MFVKINLFNILKGAADLIVAVDPAHPLQFSKPSVAVAKLWMKLIVAAINGFYVSFLRMEHYKEGCVVAEHDERKDLRSQKQLNFHPAKE